MDKKILKCAIVGGLVVFIWGLISWMVLPWHSNTFKQFQNENEVYEAIRDNASESGVYILPNMYVYKDGMSQSDVKRQMSDQHHMMSKGPVMFASISVEGMKGVSLKPFVTSLIIQIVGAGIITWMLLQSKFSAYRKQVIFVTIVGFLVGLLGLLPAWNWWGFSGAYTFTCFADLLIGWFLAGLAIGKVIKL